MAVCCFPAVPVLCRDGCFKLGCLQECFKWFLMKSKEVVSHCEKWYFRNFVCLKVSEDVHILSRLSRSCLPSLQGQCGALLHWWQGHCPQRVPRPPSPLVFSITLINKDVIAPVKTKWSQGWNHRNYVPRSSPSDFITAQPGTFKHWNVWNCYQQFQLWSMLVMKITFLS